MKTHLLTLAALAAITTIAVADSPDAILKDYREKAAPAIFKVNETLEKAAVPLVAALVKSGNTTGAAELQEQLKTKMAGEPVIKPQPSAVSLFKSYDAARAKALDPAQKAAVTRIETILASSDGKKMDIVTELGKVRAEIEAGKAVEISVAANQLFVGRSWFTKAGSEYHFNKDGSGYRFQKMDFDEKVPFTWSQLPDGVIAVQQKKNPKSDPTPTFFRFVDKKTAFQGDVEASINTPLLARQ